MKKYSVIAAGLAMWMMTACSGDSGFKRTRSGLMYKIISEKGAQPVKRGDWLKMHLSQSVHDSLLDQTYGKMPIYVPVDSVPATYDPREVIPMLRKGDSAVVVLFADSIYKKQGGLPPFIKRKDKVVLTFRVVDVFTSDSAKTADETAVFNSFQEQQQKEGEARRSTTIKDMEDFLAEKKIKYQKTDKGTYVVVKEQGSGPRADSGKVALVRYKGTMFKTGEEFDSNMEGQREPYPVRVGADNVIEGWHDGLPFFNKGGKGTLYIPFWLAYGAQPRPLNTSFANLVFDIEIVDVKDPAEYQTGPQMQPNPNK